MLNPYPATAALCDKVVQAQILSDLAIPAPLTWTVGEIERFNTGCRPPPLVVKPTRGHDGRGVHILRSPDDISALPPSLGPVIVQEYIPGRGEDLKVYVVGEQVFGVRKRYTSSSFSRPGKPCTVPPDVCEIARRLGKALGIGLFGFDVIESARGPVVVDVNKFPGYRGVPGVAPVIARYIESYALGEIHEGSGHAYAATRA
jgi:ribosomal protein S6--L-glutamate ligase